MTVSAKRATLKVIVAIMTNSMWHDLLPLPEIVCANGFIPLRKPFVGISPSALQIHRGSTYK